MINKFKILSIISAIAVISTPLISNAAPKAHARLSSTCISGNGYAQAKMVSYGTYEQRINVKSEIISGSTTIKSDQRLSYDGRNASSVSSSGLSASAYARNGYQAGSWSYTTRSESIYY